MSEMKKMISKALFCFMFFIGYHLAYAQLAKSKAVQPPINTSFLQMPFAGCCRQ